MIADPDLSNQAVREEFARKTLECLGGEWPEPPSLNASVVDVIHRDGYRIEKVRYQTEPDEYVSAFVLVPARPKKQRYPAVAVWHQHNGEYQLGKSEPAGVMGNPMHHTGVALAKEGFLVIYPDAMCFEERRGPLKDGDFERFTFLRYLVRGKCLAWKNILDMRRALDYLVARDDVDAGRIGCYGHSLGSTFTWLLAPWEPRLKCLVGNCCLPTYGAIEAMNLQHSFSNFIPGLYAHGDTPDVVSLIAPRALHLNFGARDPGSPITFVRDGLKRVSRVYEGMGAAAQFSFFIEEDAGHVLSPLMWERVVEKFRRHLGG